MIRIGAPLVLLITVRLGKLQEVLVHLLPMNTIKHPDRASKTCQATVAMTTLIQRSKTQTRGHHRMMQGMVLLIATTVPKCHPQ